MIDEMSQISIKVPSDILWGILAIFLIIFIIVSVMLNYHWKYYGIKDNPKVFTKSIHWIVSIVLILIMTVAVLTYETQI